MTSISVGPDFYRQRAIEMMKHAEAAGNREARKSFLLLAASWEEFARQVEVIVAQPESVSPAP